MKQIISEDAYTKTALFVVENVENIPDSEQFADDEFANEYKAVDVDLFMNENINFDAVVSREAIEDGSAIHDHIAINPIRMRMLGVMNAITSSPDTGKEKWEELTDIFKSEKLFKIVTHFGVYENMAMTSLQTEVDLRGIRFDASFEQMKIVGSADLLAAREEVDVEEEVAVENLAAIRDEAENTNYLVSLGDPELGGQFDFDEITRDQLLEKIEEFKNCPTEERVAILKELALTRPEGSDASYEVKIGSGLDDERIVFSNGDADYRSKQVREIFKPISNAATEAWVYIRENYQVLPQNPAECNAQSLHDVKSESLKKQLEYKRRDDALMWTRGDSPDDAEEMQPNFLKKSDSELPHLPSNPEEEIVRMRHKAFWDQRRGSITKKEYQKILNDIDNQEKSVQDWRDYAKTKSAELQSGFGYTPARSIQPHQRVRDINRQRELTERLGSLRKKVLESNAIEYGDSNYLAHIPKTESVSDGLSSIREQDRLGALDKKRGDYFTNNILEKDGNPKIYQWKHSGSNAPERISTQSRFFSALEFECKGTKSNGSAGCLCDKQEPDNQKLSSDLIAKLEILRGALGGIPITVISGYRCSVHNDRVGGVKLSRHLKGTAADIFAKGIGKERLAALARTVGFTFVSTYEDTNHVHVDVR